MKKYFSKMNILKSLNPLITLIDSIIFFILCSTEIVDELIYIPVVLLILVIAFYILSFKYKGFNYVKEVFTASILLYLTYIFLLDPYSFNMVWFGYINLVLTLLNFVIIIITMQMEKRIK